MLLLQEQLYYFKTVRSYPSMSVNSTRKEVKRISKNLIHKRKKYFLECEMVIRRELSQILRRRNFNTRNHLFESRHRSFVSK